MEDQLLMETETTQDASPATYAYEPSDNALASIEAQRSMRTRAAIASHVTLLLLLVCGGLAIAGKGPKWLRNKWVILSLVPTYFYTMHLMTRETYWMGASDTQANDGGPPLL